MRPIRYWTLVLILGATPLRAQDAGAARPARQAPAPQPAAGLTLKEVRESFGKADADQSTSLSAQEAAVAGFDAGAFSAADSDGDQKLSLDEFTIGSESRAAKTSNGVAADLTAESTRLQALRRAQKSEELKSRRESLAPSAARTANPVGSTPATGPARTGGDEASAPAAPAGPAAGRRALAAENPDAKEKSLPELRASIVRRLRNGEISEAEARKQIEAIDRRIANASTSPATDAGSPPGAAGSSGGAPAAEPAGPNQDLRSIEDRLSRRLRNSDADPAKADGSLDGTLRRAESARGASSPQPQDPGSSSAAAAPAGIRAKIAEAQSDLTRRLRNAKVTPEQAALEQAALARRLRNSVESLGAAGSSASTNASDANGSAVAGGARTPTAGGNAEPAKDAPARARVESGARSAPVQEPAAGAQPPRRASDGTSPAANPTPPPAPARGSSDSSSPAGKPVASPPAPAAGEKDRGEAKPARPAPPAPKPSEPSGGGGR